jgi:hypothetical protein
MAMSPVCFSLDVNHSAQGAVRVPQLQSSKDCSAGGGSPRGGSRTGSTLSTQRVCVCLIDDRG